MTASARLPVNLVTGFLGVGKTTAIRGLLRRVPQGERWAVLVNEFGEVGVDGALLEDDGVVVQEVAGGCLCCVAAPAFTTGLNRLIRQHRPDRILIEPSGLGHPAQVLDTLNGPLYASVLDVRATVCLMDPRHLGSTQHRDHPNFQDQIHLADLLVANKGDLCSEADTAAFEAFAAALSPPKQKLAIVEHGWLAPEWLDLLPAAGRQAAFPEAHAFLVDSGETPPEHHDHDSDWTLIEGHADGYYRAGWLIKMDSPWPEKALRGLLQTQNVERMKGLLQTDAGWFVLNQETWNPVTPPADSLSRLELIDPDPIDASTIDQALKGLGVPVT